MSWFNNSNDDKSNKNSFLPVSKPVRSFFGGEDVVIPDGKPMPAIGSPIENSSGGTSVVLTVQGRKASISVAPLGFSAPEEKKDWW